MGSVGLDPRDAGRELICVPVVMYHLTCGDCEGVRLRRKYAFVQPPPHERQDHR